jgi:hypothetical protein
MRVFIAFGNGTESAEGKEAKMRLRKWSMDTWKLKDRCTYKQLLSPLAPARGDIAPVSTC